MCVAVTGKIIEKNDPRSKVDVRGNVITVDLGMVNANVGDYVLVHAGCAIATVSQQESDELDTIYREMEE